MPAKTLVTTFDDAHEAERAVQKLQQDGFAPEGIGWVERGPRGERVPHGNLVDTGGSSTFARTAVGAVLGALAGLLAAGAAMTLAGYFGRAVWAGAVIGAVVGLAIGAAIGRRLDAIARTAVYPRCGIAIGSSGAGRA